MTNRTQLGKRVIEAAGSILFLQQYVCPIDIFVKMGYLQPAHVQDWKKGRIPYLEAAIQCNLGKITFSMKCFRKWTLQLGLVPSQTTLINYLSAIALGCDGILFHAGAQCETIV